jgi:hypothetical protein
MCLNNYRLICNAVGLARHCHQLPIVIVNWFQISRHGLSDGRLGQCIEWLMRSIIRENGQIQTQ